MSIAPFPHRYIVELEAGIMTSLPRAQIHVGAPPQFGGTDTVWSPEELLVGAVITCLQTTFDAFARRDKLAFSSWRATGTGVLEKGPAGPRFTGIDVHVQLATAPDQEPLARTVLALAERNCIVSHALTCPVRVTAAVNERLAASRVGAYDPAWPHAHAIPWNGLC